MKEKRKKTARNVLPFITVSCPICWSERLHEHGQRSGRVFHSAITGWSNICSTFPIDETVDQVEKLAAPRLQVICRKKCSPARKALILNTDPVLPNIRSMLNEMIEDPQAPLVPFWTNKTQLHFRTSLRKSSLKSENDGICPSRQSRLRDYRSR